MNIKGTESEQNLKSAFSGESQARNKYTYYADAARLAGQDDIAELFLKMANNEREHARVWFRLLHEDAGEVADSLIDAASGENYEWKSMYPGFATKAKEEGLDVLADLFERVAAIESDHERAFLEAVIALKSQNRNIYESTPHSDTDISRQLEAHKNKPSGPYRCMLCGATADSCLDVCPLCGAIGSFERE